MAITDIEVAKQVLSEAGIVVPKAEKDIRQKAYEVLNERDLMAAHQIRVGKKFPNFTREDWQNVLRMSGETAVRGNMAAFTGCLSCGLIKSS
jgi:hypothetical protein